MSVTPFATILETVRARHGGSLEFWLPQPKTADELAATPADRYLSQMELRIFRAGLKHAGRRQLAGLRDGLSWL